MITVNVHEAKTNLSRLLAKAEAGEEVIIARNGKPVARLAPVQTAGQASTRRLQGKICPSGQFLRPAARGRVESVGG